MTITAQNVIDRVRLITGDIHATQWFDADILLWINDAVTSLLRDADHPVIVEQINATPGSPYVSPGGEHFFGVSEVTFNGVVLPIRTREEFNDLYPTWQANIATNLGVPQSCFIDTDLTRVVLFPTPNTAGAVTISMAGSRFTPIAAVGTVLPVPDEWLETIVTHCLQAAKEWEDNLAGAAYFGTKKQKMMAENAYEADVGNTDTYPSVQSLASDNW